jgi:uncharacterized Ntn-hydrolase superfamily protein
MPTRPVATYSIVARDQDTGELGVAVQSHWFSVGSIVSWAEAGVGAVATQSFVDPAYGPSGLALMRSGVAADAALAELLAVDADALVRQVAMVDASGRAAAHTGVRSIEAAGHHVGDGYTTQANLMERPTVWGAMADAYERAGGDLAERMLVALEAAEREGGDVRGRQSAALLVVAGESSGRSWVDRRFDLRVEDHPDPVREMRRLVQVARVYRKLNEGDDLVTAGDVEGAARAYLAATSMVSDHATNGEAPFWVGVTLAQNGREGEAAPYLKRAYEVERRWATVLRRLPAAGLLPSVELAERLREGMVR